MYEKRFTKERKRGYFTDTSEYRQTIITSGDDLCLHNVNFRRVLRYYFKILLIMVVLLRAM